MQHTARVVDVPVIGSKYKVSKWLDQSGKTDKVRYGVMERQADSARYESIAVLGAVAPFESEVAAEEFVKLWNASVKGEKKTPRVQAAYCN